MSRVHTYSVDPDDLEELITRSAEAEAAMKLTHEATATNAELIDQR